jgi:AraC-like DNA-binding protein
LVAAHCSEKPITEPEYSGLHTTVQSLAEVLDGAPDCNKVDSILQQLILDLTGMVERPEPLDQRVTEAVQLIHGAAEKRLTASEIADKVCLSESRLVHLFSAQIGIPLRRYMLWSRLIDAVQEILHGSSFTAAAHMSGFSDSAHLSRTFRRMFGLTLSNLVGGKNSRFVQVVSCRD